MRGSPDTIVEEPGRTDAAARPKGSDNVAQQNAYAVGRSDFCPARTSLTCRRKRQLKTVCIDSKSSRALGVAPVR